MPKTYRATLTLLIECDSTTDADQAIRKHLQAPIHIHEFATTDAKPNFEIDSEGNLKPKKDDASKPKPKKLKTDSPYALGYNAGIAGKNEECPFPDSDEANEWEDGWDDGYIASFKQ